MADEPRPNMFTYDLFANVKKAYSQGTSSKLGTSKRNLMIGKFLYHKCYTDYVLILLPF
jgi:hypothetical protein